MAQQDDDRTEAVPAVLVETAGQTPERRKHMLEVLLAHVGDELGLFKDLAANRLSTCPEIAARTKLDESSVGDWLAAMIAAGYVECDSSTLRFSARAHGAE